METRKAFSKCTDHYIYVYSNSTLIAFFWEGFLAWNRQNFLVNLDLEELECVQVKYFFVYHQVEVDNKLTDLRRTKGKALS